MLFILFLFGNQAGIWLSVPAAAGTAAAESLPLGASYVVRGFPPTVRLILQNNTAGNGMRRGTARQR